MLLFLLVINESSTDRYFKLRTHFQDVTFLNTHFESSKEIYFKQLFVIHNSRTFKFVLVFIERISSHSKFKLLTEIRISRMLFFCLPSMKVQPRYGQIYFKLLTHFHDVKFLNTHFQSSKETYFKQLSVIHNSRMCYLFCPSSLKVQRRLI